jgi:PAS domain S-box-containing protein
MGSWDWEIASGRCDWDAVQYRIFGVEPDGFELTFDNIRSHIHPEDLSRIQGLIAERNGRDGTFQVEVRIIQPGGETRWCLCAASMASDGRGGIARVSGVTIDITDLMDAEARRALLVKEVDHRARNALAIVQSIVRLTKATSIGAYASTIEGRIKALATAHALLSESRWEGADLTRLIDEELAPYSNTNSGRVDISGPPVFLKPESAQILALVLHELATNAAKYGALSQDSGKVRLTWQWSEGKFALQWEESDGPPVRVPTTKGFGTRVILASVMQQLGGTATFGWLDGGLKFTMTETIGDATSAPPISSDRVASKASAPPPKNGKGQGDVGLNTGMASLLLVEDETLVGMMMKDTLVELGFHVIGPLDKIDEAIAELDRQSFQAAVLDVNLRGEMIYSLADEIVSRGIPFVFVTGYGSEAIEPRFADIPVLQKPVDQAALRSVLLAAKQGRATSLEDSLAGRPPAA